MYTYHVVSLVGISFLLEKALAWRDILRPGFHMAAGLPDYSGEKRVFTSSTYFILISLGLSIPPGVNLSASTRCSKPIENYPLRYSVTLVRSKLYYAS